VLRYATDSFSYCFIFDSRIVFLESRIFFPPVQRCDHLHRPPTPSIWPLFPFRSRLFSLPPEYPPLLTGPYIPALPEISRRHTTFPEKYFSSSFTLHQIPPKQQLLQYHLPTAQSNARLVVPGSLLIKNRFSSLLCASRESFTSGPTRFKASPARPFVPDSNHGPSPSMTLPLQ